MLAPYLIGLGLKRILRYLNASQLCVRQQLIIRTAVTIEPVIDGADQFFRLATSMLSNHARTI